MFLPNDLGKFSITYRNENCQISSYTSNFLLISYSILFNSVTCFSKETLWAWSVYFHIQYLVFVMVIKKYKGFSHFWRTMMFVIFFISLKEKKWFIGHLFHSLNIFCKVSRFKRAYFEFSIDLRKMQFLNASQKRLKMQMLRWKATLLAISEEWKPFCYILWIIQCKR